MIIVKEREGFEFERNKSFSGIIPEISTVMKGLWHSLGFLNDERASRTWKSQFDPG